MPSSPGDTCWTVVRSASRGDAEACTSFSRSYAATIRGFLDARWGGGSLAREVEDAVQDVFVECWKPGGVLDKADPANGDFRGLLFTVTRNVARRFEERAMARPNLQPEQTAWLQRLDSDEAGQTTLFDRAWALSLVRRARSMQQEQAQDDDARRRVELLRRRFQSDEAIRDIARDWGLPTQDVHNAYRKARQEFYACLREVVGQHMTLGTDLEGECRRLLGLLG